MTTCTVQGAYTISTTPLTQCWKMSSYKFNLIYASIHSFRDFTYFNVDISGKMKQGDGLPRQSAGRTSLWPYGQTSMNNCHPTTEPNDCKYGVRKKMPTV